MRLDELSKPQAKELKRLWNLKCTRNEHLPAAHLERVSTVLERLHGWAQSQPDDPTPYLLKRLGSGFYFWANNILDIGIGERFYKDDPAILRAALMQAARLGYLTYATKDNKSGQDCLHIKEMFIGLAAADWALGKAFMATVPGPSEHGHKASIRNVNLLYNVLLGEEASAGIAVESWASKRGSEKQIYDQALTDALCAIVTQDASALSAALQIVTDNHARQKDLNLGGMGKFVCYPAHALYNVAVHKVGMEPAAIATPSSTTWDATFQDIVNATPSAGFQPLIDYAPSSRVLKQWLETLPGNLSPSELM